MNSFKFLYTSGILALVLLACTPSQEEFTVDPDIPFPLSESGPYYTGIIEEYTYVDESRNGREVYLAIRYPAKEATDALSRRNAPANQRDAPYPLILTEYNTGGEVIDDHLVSHGFVMVEVEGEYPEGFDPSIDELDGKWNVGLLDGPRDLVFALEQLAANPPEGLEGIIDTSHTGVVGYSYGGLRALAVSGARVDPQYYLERCRDIASIDPPLTEYYISYYCDLTDWWEQFVAHDGRGISESADGLWQPLTDERILAVMPMGPEGAFLYGERGLAAVDRQTMIIAGSADDIAPYGLETVYIYEHLGTPERYLISFIDQGHYMVFESEQAKRINHFVTAFFGYYLKNREDFAEYFSEEYVSQYDDLAWGVYAEE
jgi:predicted dienelactone hydrolase